jgi:hypothetical protein
MNKDVDFSEHQPSATDNNIEPPAVVSQAVKLSDDEKTLLDRLPEDGSYVGIRKTRRELAWDDDRIWAACEGLSRHGLAKTGPGYGGTVRRLVPVSEQTVVQAVEAAEAAEEAKKEHELYAPAAKVIREKWARTMRLDQFVVQVTARQGRRDTGGVWTRPDIVVVAVSVYDFVPGKFVDAITFEVKSANNFDVTAIYEALSHLRSATRAYVLVEIAKARRESMIELINNASKEASRHGIGLIVADSIADFDSWEIEVEAVRKDPDPSGLDAFLSDQLNDDNQSQMRRWLR